MWTRHTTGCADATYHLTRSDAGSLLNINLRQMRQHGKEPQTVIDDDDVAEEVLLSCHDHTSCVRRSDRCANRTLKITAAVRTSRLSIEDASSPECADGTTWNRPHDTTTPKAGWG